MTIPTFYRNSPQKISCDFRVVSTVTMKKPKVFVFFRPMYNKGKSKKRLRSLVGSGHNCQLFLALYFYDECNCELKYRATQLSWVPIIDYQGNAFDFFSHFTVHGKIHFLMLSEFEAVCETNIFRSSYWTCPVLFAPNNSTIQFCYLILS